MQALCKRLTSGTGVQTSQLATPKFVCFDSSSELWPDYWARFRTFLGANSIPESKEAQVFLTNQSADVYKMLSNLAAQQSPPK